MRPFKIYSQRQKNSPSAVLDIPRTQLYHTWKCVPFDPLHPFPPLPTQITLSLSAASRLGPATPELSNFSGDPHGRYAAAYNRHP